MVGINLQTSFLTPAFGLALFYLCGVMPEGVKTIDINYKLLAELHQVSPLMFPIRPFVGVGYGAH